jgi:hypothetical protein
MVNKPVGTEVLFAYVVAALLLLWVAAVAGARGLRLSVALPAAAGVAVAIGLPIAGPRDPAVHERAFLEGVVLAGLLIGFLPLCAYYIVGRMLYNRPVALTVVWLASLYPVLVYLFFALIATVGLVACPPGSYECPV